MRRRQLAFCFRILFRVAAVPVQVVRRQFGKRKRLGSFATISP